jgi:hypothetical protein
VSYFNHLKIDGLSFPLAVTDVTKFERLNPDVEVNVLYFSDEDKTFYPLFFTSERDHPHYVNLLLLMDGKKSHNTYIRNISALVAHHSAHEKKPFCVITPYTPFPLLNI